MSESIHFSTLIRVNSSKYDSYFKELTSTNIIDGNSITEKKIPIIQSEPIIKQRIPDWVKNIFVWYEERKISELDMINAMEYLKNRGIINVDYLEKESTPQDCSGNARCIAGIVTQITDGDTIKVDGQSVRFALSSAPELNELGGTESKEFIVNLCPVGSSVLVDEDDGQTQGSYGRIIGVIYCNGVNLNEELVDSEFGYLTSNFCESSEFKNHDWARKHGC